MKPAPLLDLWQKPEGAGEPIGIVASTFTLDPDFFERDCLARFLAVESVDEGTGSADDLVARLELEVALLAPAVTVLADRSAQAERSSLRWDLLHCHVEKGLLHSKVAVLLWEHATRVIVGSANLTPAGYRRNIELAMAADLGPACVFPQAVLYGIADEIESYLELVPGLDESIPASGQARRTLQLFRERIGGQEAVASGAAVVLAPTNANDSPLEKLDEAWRGARPLRATHVSPFWDTDSPTVLETVRGLLVGRPAPGRRHRVAVTIGPGGETSFPPASRVLVDEVAQLGPLDQNLRALHAKCLVMQSKSWVAVLLGSSNHTTAGLGLGGYPRHRELNLWLGAPLDSEEGQALRDLVPLGASVDVEAPYAAPDDEDEPEQLVVLPAFFQLCRLSRTGGLWELRMSFARESSPRSWRISLPSHDRVLDEQEWRGADCPTTFVAPVDAERLPMFVIVEWEGGTTTWVVVADDRHDLPPGPGLADLRSSHLLEALATGKTLAQALRGMLEREERERASGGMIVDPLRRFDSRSSLLRRGRALAAALAALERRLAHPVVTLDGLEARLAGPLGPRFLAAKAVEDHRDGELALPDTMFTLAEIALSVSRVPWQQTLQYVDRSQGLSMIDRTLDCLDDLRIQLGNDPVDLADYLARAIKEAKRCLGS